MIGVVRKKAETYNAVVGIRRGNPNSVIMIGTHLDLVLEDPNINDNGSGSAT